MRGLGVAGVALGAAACSLLAAPAAPAAVPATCPGPDDPVFGPVQTFSGSFRSGLENSFVQIPFDVPAGSTGVRVRYCYDQPDVPLPNGLNNNTLDLGVYQPLHAGNELPGPDELRGWSGGSIRDVTIAVNGFSSEARYEAAPKSYVSGRTTRAYEPGPIPAGEWTVELGLAAISNVAELNLDDRVAWRVDVQTTTDPSFADDPYTPVPYDAAPAREAAGWYEGDFHVHGEHEPGNALMRETFDYAFAPRSEGGAGLDFVTLVDHNNDVGHGQLGRLQPGYPGKLIARGTEITTYRGHLQSQSAEELVDFRAARILRRAPDGSLSQVRGTRPARAIIDEVHAAGGYAQINHPTIFPSVVPLLSSFCRGCPWDYPAQGTDYSKVDAIEVHTGPPGLDEPPRPGPNPFTPLAVLFWEQAIDARGANSNRIAAVGSSDSHQAGDQGEGLDAVLGSPVGEGSTVVRAQELSEAGIQAAVEAGHTYVKPFGPSGPDVRLRATEPGSGATAIIGDSLESPTGFSANLKVAVSNLNEARTTRPGVYTVALFRDAVPILLLPLPLSGDRISFELPSLGHARYWLQVQREAAPEAISSPVYIDPPAPAGAGPGAPEATDAPATCAEAPALRLTRRGAGGIASRPPTARRTRCAAGAGATAHSSTGASTACAAASGCDAVSG